MTGGQFTLPLFDQLSKYLRYQNFFTFAYSFMMSKASEWRLTATPLERCGISFSPNPLAGVGYSVIACDNLQLSS
jgi:hypothetical protein